MAATGRRHLFSATHPVDDVTEAMRRAGYVLIAAWSFLNKLIG